jgi:thioredoxin 1
MTIVEIESNTQFDKELDEDFCVIKIYSSTCGPCKAYHSIFQDMSDDYEGINFLSCNINKKIFKVNAVPTTLVVKKGVVKDVITGLNRKKIQDSIDQYL